MIESLTVRDAWTTAPLFPILSSRDTSATTSQLRMYPNSAAAIRQLPVLPDGYRLKTALPIRVEWDNTARCFVAYDDTFDWFGFGDTEADALAHVSEVLLEDYLDLLAEEENLPPDLHAKLQRMKRIIYYAGQG